MLERLTKHELLHLLKDMREEKDTIKDITRTIRWQKDHNEKCWDCISIARKLNIE